MARSMFDALLKKPERMGARTQSRNTLGINHPLAESSPIARIPISMMPGGGPVSGYTQEDLATLALPEETTLFSPLGFDITDKNLATLGLTMDAVDWFPGAALVGGAATGAGLLGRALKGKNYAPTSTDDIGAALLGRSLGNLDDAMVTHHGSPHKFDALDPKKIGAGQGAQVQGHGLYVAENPDVAGGYVKAGQPSAATDVKTALWHIKNNVPINDASWGFDDVTTEGSREAYRMLTSNPEFEDMARRAWGDKVLTNEVLDMIGPSIEKKGYLYEIDVPDEDIAKMLDWDAPLSEQPESVQNALLPFAEELAAKTNVARAKKRDLINDSGPQGRRVRRDRDKGVLYNDEIPMEYTGEKLYRMMQKDAGATSSYDFQEAASKRLDELGIPGIKYFDAGSRGGIKKHQWGKIAKTLLGKDTRNMVLFDDLARRAKVLKRNDETIAQPSVDEFIGKLLED